MYAEPSSYAFYFAVLIKLIFFVYAIYMFVFLRKIVLLILLNGWVTGYDLNRLPEMRIWMSEKSNSEEQLLSDLSGGSVKAFELLYHRYSERLFGFAMRFTQQDRHASEEVVQHVFVKIWENRLKIQRGHSFFSYLCTITKNHLLNQYEHQMVAFVYQNYLPCNAVWRDHTTETELDSRFLEEFIEQQVEKLSPARQQVFRLSRYEHLSNRDIAKQLGLSESTVENQLSFALKFLKKQVEAYGDYILSLLFVILY